MAVEVKSYDPAWPEHFENIKKELESYLGGVQIYSIEHVGSTSVPGLAAKAIIDIDVVVSRENVQPAVDALVSNGGFAYLGELGIVDRHAVRDPNQSPARNVYVCVAGAFQARNHIGVRDTLRTNEALRQEYGDLKLALAGQGTTIVDYTEAKSDVIQKILTAADILTAEELLEIQKANVASERFKAIHTSRLLLREFMLADEDAMFEMESQDVVARYQEWAPRTRRGARDQVVIIVQNSAAVPRSHIELAVELNGKFIGRVGTSLSKSEDDQLVRHANLWYAFLPSHWGKGYASEAMAAFIPLLKGPLKLEIECDPRNNASWQLAERLGFERTSLVEDAFEMKGERVGSVVYHKMIT